MRYPWRRPVVDVEKFMATNWGARAFWWGAAGTAFCLAFIAWGVVAMTPAWWKWPYVAVMVGLFWVNARLLRPNYRAMRRFAVQHAAYVADTERMARLLADAGVPEGVAQRINTLALEGRVDEAVALVTEHAQRRPRP